jgi:hypothetical protein
MLVLFAAAAPTLVAVSPLRHRLPRWVCPALPVEGVVGTASLGWLSPVVLRNVELPDLQGGPLLHIRLLRTERPLWQLLLRPGDMGPVSVVGWEALGVAQEEGTTWGAFLRAMNERRRPRRPVRIQLAWTEGRVVWHDPQGGVIDELRSLAGSFDHLQTVPEAARLELRGTSADPAGTGRLTLSVAWRTSETGAALLGPGSVRVRAEHWPVEGWRRLCGGLSNGAAWAGPLSAALDARWNVLGLESDEGELRCVVTAEETQNALYQAADYQAAGAASLASTTNGHELRLHLRGAYDAAADRLRIRAGEFVTPWGRGHLTGTISAVTADGLCDLTGETTCDPEPWLALLPPAVREHSRVEGLALRSVSIRGPLRRPRWDAPSPAPVVQGEVEWEHLEMFGVASREGRVGVEITPEQATFTPRGTPVSGGRLVAAPKLVWREAGPIVRFADGPVLERVSFSEELCRGWMRFLSPLTAHATSVSGTFSIDVAAGEAALQPFPTEGIAGTLTVHEAQVGPGPLTRLVGGLIEPIRELAPDRKGRSLESAAWLTIAEQRVAFRLSKGRMHHEQLSLFLGPVELRSRGSVGVADDSLDLVVSVHFPESWFANRPLLAAAHHEGVPIVIRGTLTHPRIDGRPLLEFGRGLGLRATGRLLEKLFER